MTSSVRPPGFPAQCVWYVPTPYRRPSPTLSFCCGAMHQAVANFCDEHDSPWECNHATLVYNEPLDEYGIMLRDRDAEYVLIGHCPWCASKLPPSRRDDWFDALEAQGFEELLGIEAKDLPEQFLTAAWRTRLDGRDEGT
jgi:hypothetical protein